MYFNRNLHKTDKKVIELTPLMFFFASLGVGIVLLAIMSIIITLMGRPTIFSLIITY